MSLPYLGEGFALGAAACWAIGPLIAYKGVDAMGTFRFSMYRFIVAASVLFVITLFLGHIDLHNNRAIIFLAASGVIGVAAGEAALFQAVYLLGPRRSSVIFTLHAPLTAVIGGLLFREAVTPLTVLGVMLAFAGVYTAVIFRSRTEQAGGIYHKPEAVRRGLLMVAIAVLCQIGGALLAKEVVEEVEPFFASFIRTSAASIAFLPVFMILREQSKTTMAGARSLVVLSALVSTVGGMTFLLAAFANTAIFTAVILSSTSPVIYIFIVSILRGERFPVQAWAGSVAAVVGVAIALVA